MNNTFEKLQNGLENVVFSKTASIISGIVCAIPFVFENSFLLSYIMYIPLFYLFFYSEKCNECGKSVFLRVFLYGFGFFAVGYSFLCELYPLDFAGFTPMEAVGVIAFALTAIPTLHSFIFTLCFAFCRCFTKKSGVAVKIAVFPCIAVFSEFLQTLGPLAFPWCRVSIAQSAFLPSIQSANLFGSYFIAYIVLLINAFIAYAIINKAVRMKMLICAMSVFLINASYGAVRLALFNGNDSFTAIALQGNISSSEKWSGGVSGMRDVYLALADEAVTEAESENMPKEILILMPETALPVTLNEKSTHSVKIAEFADEKNVSFAVGAFSWADGASGNSVFIFDENGNMSQPYNKRVLVPFGEYLPYRKFFTALVPALGEINMLSGDLAAGIDTSIFYTSAGCAGAVICYESVFPSLCRRSVNDGAEVLLVATNDSWFGKSGALRHHLAASRLRAVENGIPVIRAANTGISAIINADGSYVKCLGEGERGYLLAELEKGNGRTLYSYIGDSFLILCLVITLFDVFRYMICKLTCRC